MAKADSAPLPPLAHLPDDAAPDARARVDADAEGADGSGASGIEIIRDHLRRLPGKPGVYRMIGAEGEVLYVGKARNLKARVSNYARGVGHSNRIARMIGLTRAMEFVVTATETEALLLEANLIKRLKPRFNILMRDDKSFPYIVVRKDHPAPQIAKHRGARARDADHYGPFASAWAVNTALTTLQKAFLLRTCSDATFESRSRPCMLHQIKRCSAPCVDLISPEDYAELVAEAGAFLTGKSAQLQDRLARDMHAAAEGLDFEKAARLRDRIRALASIKAAQGVNPQSFAEADVFAIAMQGGMSCIQVFFFRAGQNWGNRAYFPKHEKEAEASEVLGAFMAQFYDDKPPPALILVNEAMPDAALLAEALSTRADARVEVRQPQRGEKREIVAQAHANAREALARKMAESGAQTKLLEVVGDLFGLPGPPERIEVYDNSHIQGSHAVGAMIVAGPDGFEKSQYRKWTIKGAGGGDDFAMMREVFTRRFTRLLRDGGEDLPPTVDMEGVPTDEIGRTGQTAAAVWPDLVLIDGGEMQLAVVRDVARELGLEEDVRLVSIAKGVDRDAGREVFHVPGKAPFRLPPNDPALYYLQRLRDEAHRFAIGAHRQKRSAAIARNPLDEIAGIGATRKRALLSRFGSARGVSRAAVSELMDVPGVNADLAARIHAHFQRT
jgi:excinuclease ABC subunit C